jgi:hypothetical protein
MLMVLFVLTTNTLATQGVFTNASSIIPFKSIVLFPRYPPSEVMTILQSLSFILVTADAEKSSENNRMYGSNRAQAKWQLLVQESSVNRYNDLLFYSLFPQYIRHFTNALV